MDETDTPDVEHLLTNVEIAPACVGVGVLNGGDHLRERNCIMNEVRWIDIDVVFLAQTTEPGYVEDAGNGFKLLFADPVLDCFLLDEVVIRTLHSVPVDFANRVFRRET